MTETLSSLLGGALIGLAASVLLIGHGRIAGISGITTGALWGPAGDRSWRWAFLGGLVLAGLIFSRFTSLLASSPVRPLGAVALAGLIVGLGTRVGSGCTSGHGVCGVSRLSPRSLLATAIFMASGMLTATLMRWLGVSP